MNQATDQKKEFLKIVENVGQKTRTSGSKGEKNALDYLRGYIEKNIKGKTLFQKFKILTWKEQRPAILSVNGQAIECQSVYYSPKGKIKGTLKYFGPDVEEEGNELETYCVKSRNGTVQAFLYVSKKYPKPFYYNKQSATYLMPSVIVGSENQTFFQKNLGEKVELTIDSKYVIKKSHNLVHKLSDRKGRVKVVIGAHIDTIPDSKGILDNASGVASALIASAELKKQKLPFDVWVIYFGAEENAMFGSKFFVDTLKEKEKKLIKYMLSIDGIGLGEKTVVYAEKDYHSQLAKSFEQLADKVKISDIEEALDTSDHYYFKLLGIDSGHFEGAPKSFYYHSKEAGEQKYLNVTLSLEATGALIDFVKNISFQSPKIIFPENRRGLFLRMYRKFFQ